MCGCMVMLPWLCGRMVVGGVGGGRLPELPFSSYQKLHVLALKIEKSQEVAGEHLVRTIARSKSSFHLLKVG